MAPIRVSFEFFPPKTDEQRAQPGVAGAVPAGHVDARPFAHVEQADAELRQPHAQPADQLLPVPLARQRGQQGLGRPGRVDQPLGAKQEDDGFDPAVQPVAFRRAARPPPLHHADRTKRQHKRGQGRGEGDKELGNHADKPARANPFHPHLWDES